MKTYEDIKVESDLFPLNLSNGVKFDENGKLMKNEGIIHDCYVCVRPGNRKNVPKIYSTTFEEEGKIIFNNYGHGGIGWSVLWGSVLKSLDLAENTLKLSALYNPEGKIAVIGSGCIGCGTILMLLERGVHPDKIQIFSEKLEGTTSHLSGAMLSTASVLDEIDGSLNKIYEDINVDTYVTWQKILDGTLFPRLQHGVTKLKAYFGAEKEYGTIITDSGLDIFVEKGLIPPPEKVYVKFKDRLNLMKKYEGCFYFNTFKLMKAFYEIIFNDLKIKVNIGKLTNFKEVPKEFNIVFNCSGLSNSNVLNQDEHILPIGGHIITLKQQEINKFDYLMYSHYIYKEDVGKYEYHNAPLFYLMLKTDDESYGGLLGGSLLQGYSGGDEELDQTEYKGVLRRTFEIFGEDPKDFI